MRYYKEIEGKTVFYNGESIVIGDTRYLSPSEEIILQAGWLPYTPLEPSSEELLTLAKVNKIGDIDAFDHSLELFTIGGQQMWLGHELRQQLKTSVEAYIATGAENVTKWFNGQEFTFPCQTWLQMLAVLEVYAAEVLNTTESHKAAVNALESIEDVEQYDITEGYPEAVVFTPQMLAAMGK